MKTFEVFELIVVDEDENKYSYVGDCSWIAEGVEEQDVKLIKEEGSIK